MSTPTPVARGKLMDLGPPRRFNVAVRGHDGLSPSEFSQVPLEVFFRIASHSPPWVIVRMTHVCGEWRRTLCDAQQLWTRWEPVDLTDLKSIERVKVLAGRAKGALQELRLTVSYAVNEYGGDISELSTVMRKTLAEISKTGGRAITSVSMDLVQLGHDDQAYEMISRLVTFIEYTAFNIKTFTIVSGLARYRSGAPFWTAMPGLQHLVLTSLPDGLASQTTFFDTRDRPSTSMLRTLYLSGTSQIPSSPPGTDTNGYGVCRNSTARRGLPSFPPDDLPHTLAGVGTERLRAPPGLREDSQVPQAPSSPQR